VAVLGISQGPATTEASRSTRDGTHSRGRSTGNPSRASTNAQQATCGRAAQPVTSPGGGSKASSEVSSASRAKRKRAQDPLSGSCRTAAESGSPTTVRSVADRLRQDLLGPCHRKADSAAAVMATRRCELPRTTAPASLQAQPQSAFHQHR